MGDYMTKETMNNLNSKNVADSNVVTFKTFDLLVNGREADKAAAQAALDDPSRPINRSLLRTLLINALLEDFNPPEKKNFKEDPEVPWIRAWLLHTLGKISDNDSDAGKVIRNHLDPGYEPSHVARYWALGGLVKAEASDLEEVAEKITEHKEDGSVRKLAVAILASGGDEKAMKEIHNGLQEKDATLQLATLRALRFVCIPETLKRLFEIVQEVNHFETTYDAIVALGQVPKTSRYAESVAQTLMNFVVNHRQYARCDGMRIKAIVILGNLGAEIAATLLTEEITDENPAIVRKAARALEKVLGTRTATDRVVEAASKADKSCIKKYAHALRWMNRKSVVAWLEAIMIAGHIDRKEVAQALLSEIGGAAAFQRLQTHTRSMEQHTRVLEEAEQKIRALFERSIQEARSGFKLSTFMDTVVFFLGVGLIAVSAGLVLSGGGILDKWVGVGLTGGSGTLGVIYGTLIARPRRRVRKAVDHMMYLKIVFLAYLRQLHQIDQSYTRRLLEDSQLAPEEVEEFCRLVERIMCNALTQLTIRRSSGSGYLSAHEESSLSKVDLTNVGMRG
jgi:HEAT repeat protein